MTPARELLEAIDIANSIRMVLSGKETVAALIGISMVIGAFAATGENADLDGLMELIERGAREEFDRVMKESV